MSWSVGAVGKARHTVQNISVHRAGGNAAKLIDLCLEHQHPEKEINVSAYGSQYKVETGEVRNSLAITISPQS